MHRTVDGVVAKSLVLTHTVGPVAVVLRLIVYYIICPLKKSTNARPLLHADLYVGHSHHAVCGASQAFAC